MNRESNATENRKVQKIRGFCPIRAYPPLNAKLFLCLKVIYKFPCGFHYKNHTIVCNDYDWVQKFYKQAKIAEV